MERASGSRTAQRGTANPQDSLSSVILMLLMPSALILGAVLSLLQFQFALQLIERAVIKINALPALKRTLLASISNRFLEHLTRIFGAPVKFTPQPTHVYLVAILIAILLFGRAIKP